MTWGMFQPIQTNSRPAYRRREVSSNWSRYEGSDSVEEDADILRGADFSQLLTLPSESTYLHMQLMWFFSWRVKNYPNNDFESNWHIYVTPCFYQVPHCPSSDSKMRETFRPRLLYLPVRSLTYWPLIAMSCQEPFIVYQCIKGSTLKTKLLRWAKTDNFLQRFCCTFVKISTCS